MKRYSHDVKLKVLVESDYKDMPMLYEIIEAVDAFLDKINEKQGWAREIEIQKLVSASHDREENAFL